MYCFSIHSMDAARLALTAPTSLYTQMWKVWMVVHTHAHTTHSHLIQQSEGGLPLTYGVIWPNYSFTPERIPRLTCCSLRAPPLPLHPARPLTHLLLTPGTTSVAAVSAAKGVIEVAQDCDR